jgi:hypothetical protein
MAVRSLITRWTIVKAAPSDGDHGAPSASVGVLPVRVAARSWRRLTPTLPNIVLRWSRTVCTEMNSAVAMSSVDRPSMTSRARGPQVGPDPGGKQRYHSLGELDVLFAVVLA